MRNKFFFLTISQVVLITIVYSGLKLTTHSNYKQIQTNTIQEAKTKEAQTLFQIESNQNDVNSILKNIHSLIRNNQYNKALIASENLHQLIPESAIPYLLASHIYLYKDENQLAYNNLETAKKFTDFAANEANLEMQLKLILNQYDYFNQNINKLNAKNSSDIIHLSVYLAKTRNFQAIEDLFKNTERLNSKVIDKLKEDYEYFKTFQDSSYNLLYNLWAKTFIENQYIHYARSLLIDAINADSSSHNSYLLLSYCYMNSENYVEALNILEKAKRIDPYNTNINFYLGLLHNKNKNYKKSLEYLNKIIDSQKFEVEIHKAKGLNYYELGKFKESEVFLEKYLEYSPNNIETATKLIEIYLYFNQNKQKLETILSKLQNSSQKTTHTYNLIAETYYKLKDSKKSEQYLNLALNSDPYNHKALYNLAVIQIEKKQFNKAKENINKSYKYAQIYSDKTYQIKLESLINKIN